MLLAVTDWNAVGSFLGIGIALLLAVLRLTYVAGQLSSRIDEHNKQITENSRHITGVLGVLWPHIWGFQAMEDFLTDRFDYRRPRDMSNPSGMPPRPPPGP